MENQPLEYGVDVSFPMHHLPTGHSAFNCTDSEQDRVCKATSLDAFAQDRLDYYNNHFMKGCSQAFGQEDCLRSEQERVQMAHRQPATMKNMTSGLGLLKLRLPKHVFQRLLDFWNTNRNEAYTEEWPAGSTYINHWEAKPAVVRVGNASLHGGGHDLEDFVWDALRPIVSTWTGQHLEQASMYGIRIYKTGNVLATHVDRQPLVSSAIINVAQDLDAPWPLEVIGHDGRAHNVTMVRFIMCESCVHFTEMITQSSSFSTGTRGLGAIRESHGTSWCKSRFNSALFLLPVRSYRLIYIFHSTLSPAPVSSKRTLHGELICSL
jgi:prolyl 4-hydroxylase